MRVYTKRAAKDYPEHGIKKGETYYEWCHYRQKPQKSLTPPTESQLTADPDLAEAMRAFENLDPTGEYGEEDVRELISGLEECRDNVQERLDNVPDGLRDGSPLNEKLEALESTISNLESLADDLGSAEDEEEQTCASDVIEQTRKF